MNRVERTLDIECLPDYYLARFEDIEAPHTVYRFAMWPGGPPLDRQGMVDLLAQSTIVTFNGNHYDIQILLLSLTGVSNAALKQANDEIIKGRLQPWEFLQSYGLELPDWLDHIDVSEVAPGVRLSLKVYAGRIHAPRMQDLPVDVDAPVNPAQRVTLDMYCGNDHEVTRLLKGELEPRLDLRRAISDQYGIDVRSKSDAQIAEAVIKSQLSFRPAKRFIAHGYSFQYEPPAYIEFVTPKMQALLAMVRNARFVVSDKEQAEMLGPPPEEGEEDTTPKIRTGVILPKEIKGYDIKLGRSTYRIGIGGLHSREQKTCHASVPGVHTLSDHDVKSYYPSLILTLGMYPEQLGQEFLDIYRKVYVRRLEAKDQGIATEADGLKIVLNGTFGKLFSKWSILYAPELGIKTTLTGQLSLLMLIEMFELSGISVISANTDGIVLKTPFGMEWLRDNIVKWWEARTGLAMEATFYDSIYSRDVNNYIAIGMDGKVKRKGVFNNGGLNSGPQGKHPDKDICADAVVEFLKDRTPIEKTIRECNDIRKFVVVRGVKGGGEYNGQFLGKAVRWYYGQQPGCIKYASNGNKVAGSDGATPVMQLPTSLPGDINYQLYVDKAELMLENIGFNIPF